MTHVQRKPKPARATQPLPTLERFAATLALGSVGIAGCTNPFDAPRSGTRPIVVAEPTAAPGLAALFASGVPTRAEPHRDPWMHVAPIPGTSVASASRAETTPVAAPAKDEPVVYAFTGG